jgi:hypothetical protein
MKARFDDKKKKANCYDRIGTLFNWLAILAGAASLVMLICGAYAGWSMLHKL